MHPAAARMAPPNRGLRHTPVTALTAGVSATRSVASLNGALTAIVGLVEHVGIAAGPLAQVVAMAAVDRTVGARFVVDLGGASSVPVHLSHVLGRGPWAGRFEADLDHGLVVAVGPSTAHRQVVQRVGQLLGGWLGPRHL